ncbi:MAG: DUF1549 and DUF1553 domain-containing protein [Rubripirellula sp.]|nr:DUF1549 and DUF1553 domain-containing protein [Rubripirellula sp.]
MIIRQAFLNRLASPIVTCFLIGIFFSASTGPLIAQESFEEQPIDSFDREHWAYQPINKPPIPKVTDRQWPQNAIDHFILARLEQESLTPAAQADRPSLLRRVHFDLIGLPPTPEQFADFVSDRRPDAYRTMVDRLLASPQYGERWGQHWLDLARFAETDGFEHDKVRPTAWRYRDWVIQALSADMPYDEFVTLQLAGDVVRPDDPAAKVATSFCLSGPDMPDINSMEERKHVLMNEVTSTVGEVLLSLQVGCAQCHDHKYDPISQADFYRFRAFFERAVKLKRNQSITTLQRGIDSQAKPKFFVRGDWRRPSDSVSAAFPRIANPTDHRLTSSDPGDERFQLARWITAPSNPLAARSIVNRIWQFHFGTGLVSTPSDFGVMGAEPTHPELLDYLATQLIAGQWSLKKLHRQILLSSTYMTRSKPFANRTDTNWSQRIETDPENRLLARFPRRRLAAEAIRDAMLAASGTLTDQPGGPGVMPPLPKELTQTLLKGQWKATNAKADHYRRSIYIFARRNLRYPLFATFDRPAANCSCSKRNPSTTPIQSLLLLNSKLTLDASERVADQVITEARTDRARVTATFLRVLSRHPNDDELTDAISFIKEQSELLTAEGNTKPAHAGITNLARALFNSNAFLYVD